jgi:hypothetical protein
VTPCDITRLNRDIRVIGDIKERIFSKKTPINNNIKFKTRIIKN